MNMNNSYAQFILLIQHLQIQLYRLGEALDAEQVEQVFKDCMGEENDDGEIQYARKYFRSIPTIFRNIQFSYIE